ncbi:MAG: YdcF family protein [Flavobacteriales bacterium]|nr:YdcF family protein [Flavobacteriales bacterium]
MDKAASKAWFRRKRTWLIAVAALLGAGWLLRYRLLHGVGSVLIVADEVHHADALYVLGGASYDRGTHAAELLKAGAAPVAYCTGSNVPSSFKAEGRMITEAQLTRAAAIRAGASPEQVLPFSYGTSTFEEAQGVLLHAKRLGFDTIAVLTTDFHTRRVGVVFRKRFAGSGIHVLVASAPSSEYDADQWWNSEQGLLMVNNEYVKTLFYALKY